MAPLFGDGAAACVVRKASWREGSALHRAHMETYADGASLTEVRGGGTNFPFHRVDDRAAPNPAATREVNHFQMDGPATMRMVLQHGPGFMERLRPGLSSGLGDIAWVVPHQASGLALDAITDALGWPAERMLRTLDRLGNVARAGTPLARLPHHPAPLTAQLPSIGCRLDPAHAPRGRHLGPHPARRQVAPNGHGCGALFRGHDPHLLRRSSSGSNPSEQGGRAALGLRSRIKTTRD